LIGKFQAQRISEVRTGLFLNPSHSLSSQRNS